MKRLSSIAIATTLILLAGCGGSSSNTATPRVQGLPNAGGSGTSSATAKATLKIVISRRTAASSSSTKLPPQYVSPATQSIAVSFTPAAGNPQTFNQNLTPSSNPNC